MVGNSAVNELWDWGNVVRIGIGMKCVFGRMLLCMVCMAVWLIEVVFSEYSVCSVHYASWMSLWVLCVLYVF